MRVRFTFDWGVRLTPEQAHRLSGVVKMESGELLIGPDAEGKHRWWGNMSGDLEVVLQTIPELIDKIKLVDGELTPSGLDHIITELQKIHEALRAPAPAFNERLQVVVPSLGMLLIDEVTVVTDCCTDALQRDLDDGWRILAVCPQEARRPDYVLGRTKQRKE
jgi:hypothetical protein